MSKIYIDGEYEPGRDNIRFSGFDFHNRVFPFSAVVAVLVSALVLAYAGPSLRGFTGSAQSIDERL